MSKIQLYSFALSPYALKVKSYLLFLDVDFETIHIDPMEIRKILPVGKTVPVLTVNNESRNDSSDLGYWLNELYPEKQLVPEGFLEKTKISDEWVNNVLINHAFRQALGSDDSILVRAKKRLVLSKALDRTVPAGVSSIFRLLHMLLVGLTFVRLQIATTDKSRPLSELKIELAKEFEGLLEGGPFLSGSRTPTMSDLSAYPQIVQPKIVNGEAYFLPGKAVESWVAAMEEAVPNLQYCFPEAIRAEPYNQQLNRDAASGAG